MRDRLLKLTVLLVVLVNVLSAVFILYQTEQTIRTVTARASEGDVRLCINHPPALNITDCNATMSEDILYTCNITAIDLDGNIVSFFQIPQAPDDPPLFNITAQGFINFTPVNNQTGNHSTMFGANDNSNCTNAYHYELFNYTIVNVNDPPYLIQPIPNQSFDEDSTLFAFALGDFFADPDGDNLTFTFLQNVGDVFVNVTILNDSTVRFESDECGKSYFYFYAADYEPLSATSNLVTVDVICEDDQGEDDSLSSTGSSGGGGGGGTPCEPELVCLPWSECYPNGLQVQVCYDKSGCSDIEIKFYQECVYQEDEPPCEENWLCTDWGVCNIEGIQNRSCEDLHECGTRRFLPELERECNYNPTCDDEVMNGNETGVDCGGECPACEEIQEPVILPDTKGFPTLLVLLVMLILAVLLALLILYRERIYEGLAELGWMLSRRREKSILLTPSEKGVLFEHLRLLKERLPTLDAAVAYERLSAGIRRYYCFVLDLPFEFSEEEYAEALKGKELPDDLGEVFRGFKDRLDLLESDRLTAFNPLLFESVTEEFRLLVCMSAEYDIEEIARDLPGREITKKLSFAEEVRLRLLNGHEALQFLKLEPAQHEYLHILRAYEHLDEPVKTQLYPDVRRFYLQVKYVHETSD